MDSASDEVLLRRVGRGDVDALTFQGRVYLASYGDPPDPPATTTFITALHHAVQQTQAGQPTHP